MDTDRQKHNKIEPVGAKSREEKAMGWESTVKTAPASPSTPRALCSGSRADPSFSQGNPLDQGLGCWKQLMMKSEHQQTFYQVTTSKKEGDSAGLGESIGISARRQTNNPHGHCWSATKHCLWSEQARLCRKLKKQDEGDQRWLREGQCRTGASGRRDSSHKRKGNNLSLNKWAKGTGKAKKKKKKSNQAREFKGII